MNLSTPETYRRTVLDFCLAPLRVQLGEEAGGDCPSTLTVDGQTLPVDTWERSALRETLTSDGDGAKPWAGLVTEGIAFRIGCKLKVAAKDDTLDHPEALVTFVAAGLALMSETQHMIDLLIVAGDVGSAKKLTLFRNKIIEDVKALRALLEATDSERAEQVAADLTSPTQEALPVSSSTGLSPRGAGEYTPRKKPAAGSAADPRSFGALERQRAHARRRRVVGMSVLLLTSTVIWLIFFMPRLFEKPAEVLRDVQFRHLAAVSHVTARPPSLYVEVRPLDWDALDPAGRRELLEEIGRIAVAANYNGVQIKKAGAGVVVGRWLRQQGAELVNGS